MENDMALLPEKDLLQGTREPETTTGEFRLAMGNLRQFIADLLGIDSSDKQEARDSLGVQEKYMAEAGGTPDAVTASFTQPILKPLHGMTVQVRSQAANTLSAPTFKADESGTYPIVKGNNQPLQAGDIAGDGHWLDMKFDDTLKKWVLQNPAYAVSVMPEIAPVLAEKADRWDLDNFLPNTGGTLSGELTMQAGQKINLQSNLAIGRAYLHKYNDATWLVNTNSANETSAYISLSDDGTIELHGNVTINNHSPHYLIDSFNDGKNWWRRWSDGWLEQGGVATNIRGYVSTQTATLPAPFSNANYTLILMPKGTTGKGTQLGWGVTSTTPTSFSIFNYDLSGISDAYWYACGESDI